MVQTGKLAVISILAVLGLGALGGGYYVGNTYIPDALDEGIKDSLVVDENFATDDPKDYADWLTNEDEDDPPKYKRYYLWNLTNPDDYLNGSTPIYEELGPYVYRQYDIKINVTITSTTMKYQTYTYYEFDSAASSGSETDFVVNINPAYLGVIAEAGSEARLVTGFVGPTLSGILDGLTTTFPEQVLVGAIPTALLQVQAGVTENFHFAVNATTSAGLMAASWNGVAGATTVDNANDALFNDVGFQGTYGTPIKGVAEFFTASASFSNATIEKLLHTGVPALGVDGWFSDLATGVGVLGFLQAYEAAIDPSNLALDNATLQGAYGAVQPQLDAAAGYLTLYLINDNAVVEGAYQGANSGQTTLEGAVELFYGQWANASSLPGGADINQDGNTPDGFEVGIPIASDIDNATAAALFDPTNGLSMTNSTGIQAWFGAILGNTTLQGLLATSYTGLNATQFGLLYTWLGVTFKDGITKAGLFDLLAPAGVAAGVMSDIGYLHWGSPAVTSGLSLATLAPQLELPDVPEFWAWAQNFASSTYTFNLTNSKALLTSNATAGTGDLTNSTLVGLVLQSAPVVLGADATAAAIALGTINAVFGSKLNSTDVQMLAGYLQYMMEVYVAGWVLAPIIAAGGGLIATKTVEEWLWDYEDPLLAFLKENGQVDDASWSFFPPHDNVTDPAISPAHTFKTGADDINNVMQYVLWQGIPALPDRDDDPENGVWDHVEFVDGTDATQFHPDVKDTEVLRAWVSELARTVDITYLEDTKTEGIDLLRFVLSEDTLAVNPAFDQTVKGVANLTYSQGVPLFVSKPHFLDADASAGSVTGLAPVRGDHETFIDVEPTTGAVMNAAKRLQISFEIRAGDYLTTNVEDTHFMPVIWVEEGGAITPDLADKFKDAIYGAQQIEEVAPIAGAAVGVVLLLTSMFITIRARKP